MSKKIVKLKRYLHCLFRMYKISRFFFVKKSSNWREIGTFQFSQFFLEVNFWSNLLQTIFPGESALFDSIVDYEDLSEEALLCIIKSFPTNIDHCIQWAVRKLNSWCKQRTGSPEKYAQDKFNKNFIAKPKELLKNFPPEENPEKWKPPNR